MGTFSQSPVTAETTTGPSLVRKPGEGVFAKSKFQVRTKNVRWRRGTAVTELAICLPVLTMVIFGSIEMCNAIFLTQTLIEAGYEGALVGSQTGATESEIVQRVQNVLTARNIVGANVSVLGAIDGQTDFDLLDPGELFTVHVDATIAGNIFAPIRFATFNSVEADVVGHKQQ